MYFKTISIIWRNMSKNYNSVRLIIVYSYYRMNKFFYKCNRYVVSTKPEYNYLFNIFCRFSTLAYFAFKYSSRHHSKCLVYNIQAIIFA